MKPPKTGSRPRILPWALLPGSDYRRIKRLCGRVPERVTSTWNRFSPPWNSEKKSGSPLAVR